MELLPAETASFASPIPTQFVSSDEFTPPPQTAQQKQVEVRIKELGNQLAKHQGVSRRRFFQTAAGMAAAFVAMNDVYGPIFGVSPAEAQSPDMANERAKKRNRPASPGYRVPEGQAMRRSTSRRNRTGWRGFVFSDRRFVAGIVSTD